MNKRLLRRTFIVDRKLQGSLCLHGLVYGGFVIAAVSFGIFAPLLWNLDAPSESGFEETAIVMLYMHERFWFLAAACLAIVVLGAIKFSHRIAGPLVRYKRNLRLLAAGKLPAPLRTRSSDYLKEEVACLNDAVAGVGARVDAIRKAHAALRREVLAAVTERDETVHAALAELESALAAFEHVDPRDDLLPAPAEHAPALPALARGR